MFVIEKTKILLVYITYRYNPEAYRSAVTSEIDNQVTNIQVLNLKVFYKKLAASLVFLIKKIISYYNKYYNIKPIFKKKDKVYLI
jgi:hypothetical protein